MRPATSPGRDALRALERRGRSREDIQNHSRRIYSATGRPRMKTLVDIDEDLLQEARGVGAAATKKKPARLALEELIGPRRRGLLKTLAGSGIVDMTRAE